MSISPEAGAGGVWANKADVLIIKSKAAVKNGYFKVFLILKFIINIFIIYLNF